MEFKHFTMIYGGVFFYLVGSSLAMPVNETATSSSKPSSDFPTVSAITETSFEEEDDAMRAVRPCKVASNVYQHRESIPRRDPCELCVCVDSEMYCLWKLCPKPSEPMSTTTQLDTNYTQVEKEFTQIITKQREYNAIQEKSREMVSSSTVRPSQDPTSCYVMGVQYRLGEVLPRDTGTCLECSCSEGARVTCSPKDCASQPDLDYLEHSNSIDMFDLDTF